MLHEWDGVEDRSRTEGEGQVSWAGTHSVPAEAGKAAKPPQ